MPRERYQERLDDLRADVVAMGDLVCERYEAAVRAAATGDEALADEIAAGDDAVNETYLRLEEACIDLFALQQPVAGDLRFVAASFKLITDLERVADLATNIAAYGGPDGGVHSAVAFERLGAAAGEMVADAVAAYEAGDAAACREIATRDDDFDERCRRATEAVVRDLLDATVGAAGVTAAVNDASRALLAVRDLERVADHAVNVAARTLYMVENDDELIY